jgi:hypothetical protein
MRDTEGMLIARTEVDVEGSRRHAVDFSERNLITCSDVDSLVPAHRSMTERRLTAVKEIGLVTGLKDILGRYPPAQIRAKSYNDDLPSQNTS